MITGSISLTTGFPLDLFAAVVLFIGWIIKVFFFSDHFNNIKNTKVVSPPNVNLTPSNQTMIKNAVNEDINTLHCSNCGHVLTDDSKFCGNCGEKLGG